MISFDFDGIEEIEEQLEAAAKKFPDLAESTLKKEQSEFKKDMRRETWNKVKKGTGNIVKGFRFDNTGDSVFLKASIGIVDAIEDIIMEITI